MSACKDCKYFRRLGDNPESWGMCEWYKHNSIIKIPVWSSVVKSYGSLNPNCKECEVFESKV